MYSWCTGLVLQQMWSMKAYYSDIFVYIYVYSFLARRERPDISVNKRQFLSFPRVPRGSEHTFRLGETQDVKDGRGNIGECTLLFLAVFLIFKEHKLLWIASHDEGNRVRSVCGVWVTGLGVDHLLSVTVVGSNEQNITSVLACLVDDADGLIGVGDSLHGSIIDTGVTNLWDTASANHVA